MATGERNEKNRWEKVFGLKESLWERAIFGGVQSAQPSLQEEFAGGKEEKGHAHGIVDGHHPEGGSIAVVLRHDAAHKDADAEAHVPRRENGGIGGATLAVFRHVDKHIEESGVHVSVAQADEKGRTVISGVVWACHEQRVAHQ